MNIRLTLSAMVLAILLSVSAFAVERFPPPDFESNYTFPTTTVPPPRADRYDYLDVAVLLVALVLATLLIYQKRCRKGVFLLMVLSLAYFGFWRKGCICPIGSIGNVVLSIFDPTYTIPIVAVLFFALPLLFTLVFGRVFCAAVCPLGAIQDLVVYRPLQVPRPLEHLLRLFAWLYLGLAVLFAATGAGLLICRYDPFIGFFRLGDHSSNLILGASFLILGLFVARPYCRFVCPYGLILRQLGRLSHRMVTITPAECVNCHLCGEVCPFNAIDKPTTPWPQDQRDADKRRLTLSLVLLPVLVAGLAWAGTRLDRTVSRYHDTVRLAEEVAREQSGIVPEVLPNEILAVKKIGRTPEAIYAEAAAIRRQFRIGCGIFGGFIGLVIGIKLVNLSVRWRREEYQAHRAACLACARCFEYCPVRKS
jgi:NosR/NirI family transcriptional regulator, nitrous oxide reductase regulator